MGRRGMPGRRRQLIQLDNAPKTSYLTQTGCYRPDDIFIESKNIVKSSLSLVCDYTGSDSESEEESDKGENDSNLNRNGSASVKKDDVNSGNEAKDSLHAEMLGIVGAKVETPSDIFRREFNAYQKETAAPSYNREFIAFQKETSPSLNTSSSMTIETVTTMTQPQKVIVAPKENSTTSVDSKSVSGTTEISKSVPKSSDIDSQVASFLAEIDALGEDTGAKDKDISAEDDKEVDFVVDSTKNDQLLGPDAKETTEAKGEIMSVVASYKSSGESSSSEEEPVAWPEEPVSEWQQCHDESTQHYYYWNINTNEVTWEIPPEFTQYLLLFKEYELTMSRLIKEGKTKPKKKKNESKRDLKKSGHNKSESLVMSTDDKTVSETAQSSELQSNNVIDKKEKSPSEETVVEPRLLRETSSPDITENTQCSSGNSENINKDEKTIESDSNISLTAGSSPVVESLETAADKYIEGTAGIADENGANTTNDANCASSSSSSTSSSSSSNNESIVSTVNISDLTIEMCKKKFKARMHRDDTVSNKQEQQTTSELNSETNTSIVNNKEASAASDSEQSNIDIDEVDRELELALERKVNELRRLEEEEKQCEVPDRHHMKRKYRETESGKIANRNSSDEECCVSKPPKKSKTHKHASKRIKEKKESSSSKRSESSSKKRSSHKEKKESRSKSSRSLNCKSHLEESSKSQESDEKLKETVMDLNQLVMDKMDFLEIDINKPSKLQVLLVQLKTRSSDWQAGGLSTSYFFERLQEANQQIIQFEKSGAPTGWSVCWDRTYKRYFYCNNTTGHSQWDYPELPTKEELNGMSETMQQSLTLALSSTPPPPPPTPPPTPSLSVSSLSSSSTSTTTTMTTSPVHESTKTASPVRSISSENKINNGQEPAETTKCSDNLKKEKKNRKLEKLVSKCSKTGSESNKSHSENLHMSSSKDFDSELCVYPGEPPPPGTEVSKQHSLQHLEEVKLSKSGEEDLEEVMKLAAVLAPAGMSLVSPTASSQLPSLESSERTSTLDINDDMELDPDENVPSSVHLLSTHSNSYKSTALSSNSSSNGHHLFPHVDAANCIQNNSAVISKPPQYKTRPAVSSDTVVGTLPTSNSDSSAVYASKTNPTAISSMDCFYLSKSSVKATPLDSANASNSPISQETNDIVETIKPQPKEKKRKKDKVITSTNLTLKKKNVSSLVQKWQKVKKEVEKEDELARHEFSDDD